jgi:hypothetical protein
MTKAKTRYNRVEGNAERVHVYLTINNVEEVRETAKRLWMSMSEWVDEACAEKLERDKKIDE